MNAQTATPGFARFLYKAKKVLVPVLALALLAYAAHAMYGVLQTTTWEKIVAAGRDIPPHRIALSAIFALCAYVAMSGYDGSGLSYVRAKVPRRGILLGGFSAFALGNSLGLATITSAAVRFRIYGAYGIDGLTVARAFAFVAVAYGMGITAVAAFGVLMNADAVAHVLELPAWVNLPVLKLLSGAYLAGVLGFVVLGFFRRSVRIGRLHLAIPGPRLALSQIAISLADICFAGLTLWLLLPPTDMAFTTYLALFAVAIFTAVLTHLPLGLGAFDLLLAQAFGSTDSSELVAALLLYRVFFYIVPMMIAVVSFGTFELRRALAARRSPAVTLAGAPVAVAAPPLLLRMRSADWHSTWLTYAPLLLAGLSFLTGGYLIVSGLSPLAPTGDNLLQGIVPGEVREASHFLSSVAGVALLVLTRGLLHRLDGAWWIGMGVTIAGIFFSGLKGLAVTEILALAVLAVLLFAARPAFRRRASLLAEPWQPGWLIALAAVAGAAAVVFFVTLHYKPNAAWWHIVARGGVPREQRALLAIFLAAGGVGLWQLLQPARGRVPGPSQAQLSKAVAIVEDQDRADAALVRLGDKSLLFSDSGRAFLMFVKLGRSWIALGDPVGPSYEWPGLIRRFVEEAERFYGRAAFYQLRPNLLTLYLDAGLSVAKLGEEARVPLATFLADTHPTARLRAATMDAARSGVTCRALDSEEIAARMDALRTVSDAWLATRNAREKGFSTGAFDPGYLKTQDIVVAEREGTIVAFVSLMRTNARQEATVDLLRHVPELTPVQLSALLVAAGLHARQAGMAELNLGIAPPDADAREQAGASLASIVAHADRFYTVAGLRALIDDFHPVWAPRYLAVTSGFATDAALRDVAALAGNELSRMIPLRALALAASSGDRL